VRVNINCPVILVFVLVSLLVWWRNRQEREGAVKEDEKARVKARYKGL